MALQQDGARGVALHQHPLPQVAVGALLQSQQSLFHLGARREQDQSAAFDLLQVHHQGGQHFVRVGLHVFRIGLRLHHDQAALLGVVEGALHLAGVHRRVAVQARLAQEMIEGAAGGQRGRCDHSGAHALPQMVAQQLPGLHRTGVRAERDQAVAHLRLQPLGQGRLLAHGRFQPAPGGLFHALQARGQHAQTAVELRQTGRVPGVVARLSLELRGHALEHLEQGAGVALQRLDPRHPLTRQFALVEPVDHRWRLVVALAALAVARGARHQGRPSWLLRDAHHAHARELALCALD